MLNKIIILGSGNSGSGAIYDYLAAQKQNLSFLNGKEFRLNHDPDGLSDLYINNYINFSINNSASSFERFGKVAKNFARFNKNNKLYLEINNFFKDTIKIRYNAYPEFYKNRIYLEKKLNFYFDRIVLKKRIRDLKLMTMTIPVNEKKFVARSIKLINNIIKILYPNPKGYKNIIFNQSANYWNIEETTKFFDKKKIIIVDRDPRSIFWSMKRTEAFSYPGHDVKTFIEWYKEIQNIFEKKFKNKKNILKINYEKFLNNFDVERKKLNKFVGLNINENSKFNLKKSLKNLYKAKSHLTKKELRNIESNLRQYLRW